MVVTLQEVHQAGHPCWKEHKTNSMLLGFNSTSVLLTCGLHMPINTYMLSLCALCSPWPCIVIFLSSLSANSCQTVTSPRLLGEGLSKNPLKSSRRKKTLRGSDPISRWTGGFCIFSFTSQPPEGICLFSQSRQYRRKTWLSLKVFDASSETGE